MNAPSSDLAVTAASQVVVGERVTFRHRGRKHVGYVCKKKRQRAHVVCDDGSEAEVPYVMLRKILGAEKKLVQSRTDCLRLKFDPNDRVKFQHKERWLTGRIARLNPKRARIVCEDGREYSVSYSLLMPLDQSQDGVDAGLSRGPDDLTKVESLARSLMAQYLPSDWSFQFDNAARRAGCCNYHKRVISLSYEFARKARESEVRDTILHEIAHAIVGADHHHDAVWRAKAIEIGCSGECCHDLQFTPPRYIMRCGNGCWVNKANRRRKKCICSRCGGTVTYETYTEERWEKERRQPKS